jgi:hypothetical protein
MGASAPLALNFGTDILLVTRTSLERRELGTSNVL